MWLGSIKGVKRVAARSTAVFSVVGPWRRDRAVSRTEGRPLLKPEGRGWSEGSGSRRLEWH